MKKVLNHYMFRLYNYIKFTKKLIETPIFNEENYSYSSNNHKLKNSTKKYCENLEKL